MYSGRESAKLNAVNLSKVIFSSEILHMYIFNMSNIPAKYTMHNKFSNFLCLASFLCSSLFSVDQFQLQ